MGHLDHPHFLAMVNIAMNICVRIFVCELFFRYIPRRKITGLFEYSMFKFRRNVKQSFTEAILFYISIINIGGGVSNFSHSLFLNFFGGGLFPSFYKSIPVDTKWYLTMASSCIFLRLIMLSIFFMCLMAIYAFSLGNV